MSLRILDVIWGLDQSGMDVWENGLLVQL